MHTHTLSAHLTSGSSIVQSTVCKSSHSASLLPSAALVTDWTPPCTSPAGCWLVQAVEKLLAPTLSCTLQQEMIRTETENTTCFFFFLLFFLPQFLCLFPSGCRSFLSVSFVLQQQWNGFFFFSSYQTETTNHFFWESKDFTSYVYIDGRRTGQNVKSCNKTKKCTKLSPAAVTPAWSSNLKLLLSSHLGCNWLTEHFTRYIKIYSLHK